MAQLFFIALFFLTSASQSEKKSSPAATFIQARGNAQNSTAQQVYLPRKGIAQGRKIAQNPVFLVSDALVTLLLVSISVITFRNTRRKRSNSMSVRHLLPNKQDSLLAILEDERCRIAIDIHDSAGAAAVSIKNSLTYCLEIDDPKLLSQAIKANIEQVDRLADNLRFISHRMMPVVLKEHGLGDSIAYILRSLFSWSEIKYKFENQIEGTRYCADIELGLYRITEELLGNVLKHSFARNVQVILYETGHHVVIIVEDDGAGLPKELKKGLGINSIELRLKQIDGRMNFENKLPTGLVTVVSVPID